MLHVGYPLTAPYPGTKGDQLVIGGSSDSRKETIRAGVSMSEIIDLIGDDTVWVSVDAFPAQGRGHIPLNNSHRERDKRRLQ